MAQYLKIDDLQYPDLFLYLTPLMGIIYYEGIRDNHVLFLQETLSELGSPPQLDSSEETILVEIVLNLFSQTTLTEMQECIKHLSPNYKKWVYSLYLQSLKHYREIFRNTLH